MRLSVDLSVLLLLAMALSLPAAHCLGREISSPGFDFSGSIALQIDQGSGYLANQPFQMAGEGEHFSQSQGDSGVLQGPEFWEVKPEIGKDQALASLPQLSLAVDPSSGFSPLTVGFRVFGAEMIPYVKWELDIEGDNIFEQAGYGAPVTQATYYNPGTYLPKLLFYDSRGQVIAYAQGRVDVQSQFSIPMGGISNLAPQGGAAGQIQPGIPMGAISNPPQGGASGQAQPGSAMGGISNLAQGGAAGQGQVQKRAPNAPKDLEFIGWTEVGDWPDTWPVANFEWKDNSSNEDGFKIFRGEDYMGSRPANSTNISVLPVVLCGVPFTYHIIAYNAEGNSAPSSVTVDDICPPAKKTFDFSVGPGQSSPEYKFNVFCPGVISARATWTGTASDLDLTLEGPRNYGRHAPGHSPISLSYMADPGQGIGWKIFIQNNIYGGSAKGTITLTYPQGCL